MENGDFMVKIAQSTRYLVSIILLLITMHTDDTAFTQPHSDRIGRSMYGGKCHMRPEPVAGASASCMPNK